MDYKTKEYYRNKLKEIANQTKISEIYIAKKVLELTKRDNLEKRKQHVGYYLIDKGINELYKILGFKKHKVSLKQKSINYITLISFLEIISLIIVFTYTYRQIRNVAISILLTILLIIPISEIIIQIIQYILSKTVNSKIIPKIDFSKGIDEESSCMVIIPTIIKSKEKVKELVKKIEIYYLANKSANLYFCILGDCSESDKKETEFDNEVIESGTNLIKELNLKYKTNTFPIFNFIYRNRVWNDKEEKYLGWERKRGMINQFNDYILGKIKNPFRENTIEKEKNNGTIIPQIKYIITLDSDTDLILNSAFKLVGAMAHILNKPVIKENKVIDGHALIQPRVGIDLEISNKNLFTKIFAGSGGIDFYTNAISDIYQDNFEEGIFTGKGIYDLDVFSKVLKNEIPENLVLSHDLLEGSYLRCGLATDIMLIDGYPTKYNSFITRLSRWIRGDWQIISWLKNKKLNTLSKFKIIDNLRRSLLELTILVNLLIIYNLSIVYLNNFNFLKTIIWLSLIISFILNFLNMIFFRKKGEEEQKSFTTKISGFKGTIIRLILHVGCFPYKAYVSVVAITKTLYRLMISKKKLLEWTTSEEAEKTTKNDVISYYKNMSINVIIGIVGLIYCVLNFNLILLVSSILWIITPYIMCKISINTTKNEAIDILKENEKEYLIEIANKTWQFFNDFINEKNNYLIPDNYQKNRKNLLVNRTSSTNIGLSILSIISAYDLKFISFEETIQKISNIINTVNNLEKWNGHLYNWYNTENKIPLYPKYVSTVDSGNFIGYLLVLKQFLIQNIDKQENVEQILEIVNKIIADTDFSKLYSNEHGLFSIGFNIEENKLTDSYYDLLASEARQTSFIAIAKKDVDSKHWNNLSRVLTNLNKYRGLISWSGTAFEYLMPNINMPKYDGSLLDESCNFMLMSQMEYSKKLGIPWGFSEAAFNMKDLNSNYQYKAFGIPWLGLKRGLADEIVVSSYGSILAVSEAPKEVVKNIKLLEEYGMLDKYGLYESVDFTPSRTEKNKKFAIVKTYMAHHQGLILNSINNLINKNILQKRFLENPEIEATSILLQEKVPETAIITKEEKVKPEKLKYRDYENYIQKVYNKIDERLIRGNVIANENYTIAINQKGQGVSKYKNYYINRFKITDNYNQGIFFFIKNIKTNNIWKATFNENKKEKNVVKFMPDKDVFEKENENIKTKLKITTAEDEPVEIRSLEIENFGEETTLEISSFFEPVLSEKNQDYAHPAFNNLFLILDYNQENNYIIIKRKKRSKNEQNLYLATKLYTKSDKIVDMEFEIDKEKFLGRGNLGIPKMIKNAIPFSKKLGLVTEPIVAMKDTIKIKENEKTSVNLIISANENKEMAIENLKKYENIEKINQTFEISKARCEAESIYLGIKGKEIEIYQKLMSYIIFDNPIKAKQIENLKLFKYNKSDLWKYGISGDLPIILVLIKDINEIYVLRQVLKAYEYFKSKNLNIDILVLNEEKYSYENYLKEEIEETILNKHLEYMKNVKGGIYVISKSEIDANDINLFKFISDITIDAHLGNLENNIKDLEEEYLENTKQIEIEKTQKNMAEEDESKTILSNINNLKYFNEYGAFSQNGNEYLITINKENRTPTVWAHVLANKNFGSVLTENMGGFSWYKNSRLNRISAWNNSAVLDIPSEIIYIKDKETNNAWSLGANPMPDNNLYNIVYGFGYAKYLHNSNKLIQEIEKFIPIEDNVKIGILKLKNEKPTKRNIKLIYYIKPVLDEDEIKSVKNINLKYEKNNNTIILQNLYNEDFRDDILYISSSEKIKSFTGNSRYFLGKGGIKNPDGLNYSKLNNENSIGKIPCLAVEIEIELESYESKEISIIMGETEDEVEAKDLAYKYANIQNCKTENLKTKNYWKNILETIKVETPLESMNIMLNGWTMYQTIACRMLGRSGFYQSGGAYGFRDQLQDSLALKYINPEMLKHQILKHSKHQFEEGDVEHWWHEETLRGIRTRFSDDLLWLVYATIEYIETTGDKSILEEQTPYLKGEILKENEDEKYDKYLESDLKESIYDHCIKSIEKSKNFGENGLPKIGSGDWNDGLSEVGNKGIGESVWLGFFLYLILDKFIPIMVEKQDKRVEEYEKIKENLKIALNKNGWDGRWYKRAFTDDKKELGSMKNEECRIDSIAQSWSVISNAGDNDKKYISMESLENHLVDKENGLIKLLDPPFNKGNLEPGYIKAYLPGVRENGGQYTHAAIWAIIAEAILGFGDKALELYKMINPIEHARTKESTNKYKVEPYVIPADVYSIENLAGRGGWTWYTGSSSWYYKAGIEYILGLKINNNYLTIKPCIPKDWKEYKIQYRYKDSIYNIKVINENKKNTGIEKALLDGKEVENKIFLDGNGKVHTIEMYM